MTGLEQDIGRGRPGDGKIEPAQRIKRLPPYLFGRLNALKLAKRRAGVDIIDLGMGNPSDCRQWSHILLSAGQRHALLFRTRVKPLVRKTRDISYLPSWYGCGRKEVNGIDDSEGKIMNGKTPTFMVLARISHSYLL